MIAHAIRPLGGLAPNPSIERTFQWLLRTFCPAARVKRQGSSLRSIVVALLGLTFGSASAQPVHGDACFVRTEPSLVVRGSTVRPAASESRLGIRRKTGQLFDVELSVVGSAGALCSVSGVAKLRDGEILALPVRPERAAVAKPAAPCLVYLRTTPEAVEVTTTEASCQAQSLCGGQVQLQGQRFELTTRVPPGNRSQCFARPAP